MAASSLRAITIGVADLTARVDQLEKGCGFDVLASGSLTSMTASRLFDTHLQPAAAVLGRVDRMEAPLIRLIETEKTGPARSSVLTPGPLGTGFSSADVSATRGRLASHGVRFLSPCLEVPPLEPMQDGPRRLWTAGPTDDGDFLILAGPPQDEDEAEDRRTKGDSRMAMQAWFVVTNLNACLHFMSDVLGRATVVEASSGGPTFDQLFGLAEGIRFRIGIPREAHTHPGIVFLQFEERLEAMGQCASLTRGLCRLRYDTDDLHETLSRVPGGGGSLVRGPASIDDPVLGRGLVAMVRAPFGVLIELWQTS